MRASSPSGFSIEVTFDGLGSGRQSFRHAPSARRGRARRQTASWPILLCGMFATFSAAAAFAASPLGQHPRVRPHTEAAKDMTMSAWHYVEEHMNR
jgi:hypothetical protein